MEYGPNVGYSAKNARFQHVPLSRQYWLVLGPTWARAAPVNPGRPHVEAMLRTRAQNRWGTLRTTKPHTKTNKIPVKTNIFSILHCVCACVKSPMSPPGAQLGPKLFPNRVNLRPSCATLGPSWAQVGAKCVQVGPRLEPSCPKPGPTRAHVEDLLNCWLETMNFDDVVPIQVVPGQAGAPKFQKKRL